MRSMRMLTFLYLSAIFCRMVVVSVVFCCVSHFSPCSLPFDASYVWSKNVLSCQYATFIDWTVQYSPFLNNFQKIFCAWAPYSFCMWWANSALLHAFLVYPCIFSFVVVTRVTLFLICLMLAKYSPLFACLKNSVLPVLFLLDTLKQFPFSELKDTSWSLFMLLVIEYLLFHPHRTRQCHILADLPLGWWCSPQLCS